MTVNKDNKFSHQRDFLGINESAHIYTQVVCHKDHRIFFYSLNQIISDFKDFEEYSCVVWQKINKIIRNDPRSFVTKNVSKPKNAFYIGTIDLNVFKQEEVLKELPEMLDKLGYKKEDSAAILEFTQDFYASKKKTEYDEAKKKGLSLQSGPETEWTQRLQQAKKIDEESNSGIRYRLLLLQTLFAQKVKPSFQQEWLLAFGDLKNLTSVEQLALARELSLCKEIPFVVVRLLKSVFIHKLEILLPADVDIFLKLCLAYLQTIPKESPLRYKFALESLKKIFTFHGQSLIIKAMHDDNMYALWIESFGIPLRTQAIKEFFQQTWKLAIEKEKKRLVTGVEQVSTEKECHEEQKQSAFIFYKMLRQYACAHNITKPVHSVGNTSPLSVEKLAPELLWQRYIKTEERQQSAVKQESQKKGETIYCLKEDRYEITFK